MGKRKIFIPVSRNNYKEVDITELLYCLGEGCYTTLYFVDNTNIVITKLLKEVENVLVKSNFLRINKNYLVNSNFIKSYSLGKEPKVIMINDIELPISRRKKEEFKEVLQSLFSHM